jgi:dihydrofolate reductase
MRKTFAFIVTTVDGYCEGPGGEFDWPVVDAEFNDFAAEQLDEIGTLLFGRVTYEGMAEYWPTPAAIEDDPRIAATMNRVEKVVVSRTLDRVDWENTRLIKEDVAAELARLKEQPGKAVAIFGSSALTSSLLRLGLVDEVRIMVHPVVLGAGRSVFRTAEERIALRLLRTRPFASGSVMLYYEPVR